MVVKAETDGIHALLGMGGFNRRGETRLSHLADHEIALFVARIPEDKSIWPIYSRHIQCLLSKIDVLRKSETGRATSRPLITDEMAGVVCKLSYISHLSESGFEYLLAIKLRTLIIFEIGPAFFEMLLEIKQEGPIQSSHITISTQTAIQFLELYRDELLEPPRIKTKKTFDMGALHDIECGNFNWMDDNGEAYLEAIRDMPFETFFDELPKLQPVLDWFVANKPTFDKNQIKRGWMYLEKSSDIWHESNLEIDTWYNYDEKYTDWECPLAEILKSSQSILPMDSHYLIVPLTTPQQLLEEGQAMRHCVASYIDDCMGGDARIFSIRMAETNKRFATAELRLTFGKWQLVQLKGVLNLELIHRMSLVSDPLAMVLNTLVDWYNANHMEVMLQKTAVEQGA